MSQHSDVEIACEVRVKTEMAYLIYDGKQEVWIPKSQIHDECEEKGKIVSIFISEWLATQKGLV